MRVGWDFVGGSGCPAGKCIVVDVETNEVLWVLVRGQRL